MQNVFSCNECNSGRPCISIVDDASVNPDRCNYSTGTTPAKWVRLEISPARQSKGSAEQKTDNKPSMQVCPHARLKWSVYDCTIKDSFALDLMDCNGEGTYSIPGNSGFGYSHQCNKVTGKPAHVG